MKTIFSKICSFVVVLLMMILTLAQSGVAPPVADWTVEGNSAGVNDFLGTTNDEDLRIYTNNSQKMVITVDGNVGIGTASPNALLDVHGSAIFNDNGGDNDFRIEGDSEVNLFFVDASTDRIGIGTASPSSTLDVAGTVEMTGFKLTTSPTNGYVLTSDGSGVGTWASTIGGSGTSGYIPRFSSSTTLSNSIIYTSGIRVGIGTSDPQAILDVFSQGSYLPQLRLTYNTDTVYTNITTTSEGYLYLDSTGGRVGIGTADPLYALDINGDVNITGNLNVSGSINTGSGGIYYDSENNRMGINTTNLNPDYALTATGDIWFNSSIVRFGNSSIETAAFKNTLAGDEFYRIIFDEDDEADDYYFAVGVHESHKKHTPAYATSERFWIREDGKVGVGAQSPLGRLWVHTAQTAGTGTITTSGTDVTGSGTFFTSELVVGSEIWIEVSHGPKPVDQQREIRQVVAINSNTDIDIDSAFSQDITSGTSFDYSRPILSVETNEKVGISTISPTEKLDVNGKVRIRDLTDDENIFEMVVADATGVLYKNDGEWLWDDDWYEVGTTDPPNDITDDIFTQGNVGIGIASPSEELHVVGNIRMVDGNEGTDKVLTSDANGVGSWQDRHVFKTIVSNDGQTIADSPTDTLTIVGVGIASTSITGEDELTITATEAQDLEDVLAFDNSAGIWSINMNNKKITNVGTPTAGTSDAMGINFADGRYLRKDADTTQDNGYYIATDKIQARDSDGLKLYEDGGSGILIKDGGYVGIGKSPDYEFEVYSGVTLGSTGLGTDFREVWFNGGTDNIASITHTGAITGRTDIGWWDGSALERYITIKNGNGEVGIGKQNPQTVLHIGDDGDIQPFITLDEANGHASIPTEDDQIKIYVKADNFIIEFNDGGTAKYWYINLDDTAAQNWSYSTSGPN